MDEITKGIAYLQNLFGDEIKNIHVLSTASPVQIEGTINEKRWYFHARWDGWFLRVEQDPRVREDFITSDTYQTPKDLAASTMPLDDAFQFVAQGLIEFSLRQPPIPDDQILPQNQSSIIKDTYLPHFALLDLAQQAMFLPKAVRSSPPKQFLAWLRQYGQVVSEGRDQYTFRGTTGIITRFRLSQEDGLYLIGRKEQKIW